MKVIDANDLLKKVEGLRGTTNHNVMWTDGYHTAICDVKCIIENMPHVSKEIMEKLKETGVPDE
jgi:hypothetical protein